jgi:serine/threonine-protein kinase
VLLSAGEAVVADFGIARAISEAGGEHLTETGISIGTPAYMSPEQASGEHKLDGRSDIYSLGCVLYEMLAGEPPHTGPTAQAIIAKRITEPAPRVTTVRETVPGPVADALERALARLPADRLAPADRFSEALTGPAAAPTAEVSTARKPAVRRSVIAYGAIAILAIIGAYTVISRAVGPPESAEAAALPRLAVLPFENLGSSEDDYFADGITEEITSRIAQISGLRVISRQSAIQYKDSERTLQQIGEELSVDYVLEGTIRTDRAPDGSGQVRVTPQLIRVSDDAHLWTDRYTANLVAGEIFAVQEQIANQVAAALDVTLLEPERRRLAAQPTDNQEAYEYYLRGNDYYNRSVDEQDVRIAIESYQKVVELDPEFALAYARLSIEHSLMWWYFYDRTQERLAMAREAVDHALRLDPDLPEAHEALGYLHYWGHLDYEPALAEFAIALKSQPNSGDLFGGIGAVHRRQGKFVEALANLKQAAELDPRSAPKADEVAETYVLLRNPVEAGRYYDRAIHLVPDRASAYAEKAGWVHLRLEGSTERARAVLEEARSVRLAEDPNIVYAWILLEILDGDFQAALDRLALVSSDVLWADQWLHVPKAQLYAQIHGLTGNRQLEQAYYDSTRSLLEAKIQQHPDDERYRSALGIAYAGLGRKAEAIREGELAVQLLPMSKEAWRGAHRLEDLARIYTMVGEYDAAIDQLEILLAVPSPTSVPMLRIEPTWKPLRDHPRFQALLEKYGS